MANSPPIDEAPRAPDPSSGGPAYAIPFGTVWRAVLDAVAAMGRWSLVATDPVRGEIEVAVRGRFGGAPRPLRVRVSLDEVGLTRVDAGFRDAAGTAAAGSNPRPIDRFHRRLERLLSHGRAR